MAAKPHLRLVTPPTVNRTVTPKRVLAIGMAYEQQNWSTCGGTKWISKRPPCTSVESSRVLPARIPSWEMNCELCGGSDASRSPGRRSCSPQSEVHLSLPLGLRG